MTNRMNRIWGFALFAAAAAGASAGTAQACGPFEVDRLFASDYGNQIPAIVCDSKEGATTTHFSFPAIDLGDAIEIQVAQEQDGKIIGSQTLHGETFGFRCFSPDQSLAYAIRVSEAHAPVVSEFQMHVSADRTGVKGVYTEGSRSVQLSCTIATRGIVSGGN